MRSVLAWLAIVVALSGDCLAQVSDPPLELVITGPDGQWVSVAAGYFGTDVAKKTHRLQLSDGRATLPLASGHAGYAVDVFSATKRPITVQLRKQGRVLDKKQSDGIGNVMVRTGRVASADQVSALDISLGDAQRATVSNYLGAFIDRKTKSTVSTAAIANIDWPSLDAYSAVASQVLGAANDTGLDGWVTWRGKRNARIYAGPMRFQNGDADVILAELNNKLVDFIITSERLPNPWFTGPAAVAAYAKRGEELLRSMFEGNIEQAHTLFSFRVQKEITVKKLQAVHETLVRQFGDSVDQIEMRSTRIDPVKDPNNRNLTLIFEIATAKDVDCEGRVEVLLDHAVGTVPRGHLTSFNVRKKGPTISDQRKRTIEIVMRALMKGDAAPFTAALHPAAEALLDSNRVEAEVMRWESNFGRMTSDLVWSDWADTPGGRGIEGPIVIKNGIVNSRVDFAGDQLLGVTLSGNTYSGSTLGRTVALRKLADHGRQFWTRLFSGDNVQAYAMLPPIFQKQLSREQFEAMGAKVVEVAKIGIGDVRPISVRLDTRDDRVEDVMVTALYLIRFKNNTYESGRCEYHIEDADTFAIYNFNTEFVEKFPVAFDRFAPFVTALHSGDVQKVIRMFHPSDRKAIDPLVLGAFMEEIRETLGELTDDKLKGVAERRYENGTQRTYVSADLPFKQATVPAQWSFLYGWMKSFDIESRKLVGFAKRIENTAAFRRRGEQMYSLWFANKIPQTLDTLMPAMRNKKTADRFSARREILIDELGPFRKVAFVSEKFDEQANVLRQKYSLEFERGTATGSLALMFDAMQSHIALAEVEIDVPKDGKK